MTVILVIHILVSCVLVGVVLLQRSEGGALGVGGGGGGGAGGLMSGRGAAGALVRTTIIFGAIFFITSLVLTVIATRQLGDTRTAVERELEEQGGPAGPADLFDPDAPLLDDTPSSALDPVGPATEPETSDPLDAGPATEDPLAAEVPAEQGADGEEAVEEPQQ